MIDKHSIRRENSLSELLSMYDKPEFLDSSFLEQIDMERLMQDLFDIDPESILQEDIKNESLPPVESNLPASMCELTKSATFPNIWLEESTPTYSLHNYDENDTEQLGPTGSKSYNDDIAVSQVPEAVAEYEVRQTSASNVFCSNVTQSQVMLTIPESNLSSYEVHNVSSHTRTSLDATDYIKHEQTCSNVFDLNQHEFEETIKSEVEESDDVVAPLVAAGSEKIESRDFGKRLVRKRLSDSVTSQNSLSDFDDESDGDSNSDCSSDNDSIDGLHEFAKDFLNRGCNQTPYFWQYNAQNRGPKGRRLYGAIQLKDPHVLDDFVDPVTKESAGHHGSDPRPSPEKLLELGSRIKTLEEEFKSLSSQISVPKSDVNRRKNMMASRICRLKRKALHEANKIKLSGLKEEHRQLQSTIANLVSVMIPTSSQLRLKPASTLKQSKKAADASVETGIDLASTSNTLYEEKYSQLESSSAAEAKPSQSKFSPWGILSSLTSYLSTQIKQHLKYMIAGHTTDYVNMELKRVAWHLIAPQSHTN